MVGTAPDDRRGLRTPVDDAVAGERRGEAGSPDAFFVELALYLVTALGVQLMTFEDMTLRAAHGESRLESAQGEFRDMVTTDPLTGCKNRRFFDESSRASSPARRYASAVALPGHRPVQGDQRHARPREGTTACARVAAFSGPYVREADYVFRWGGDEFLVLIACDEEEARRKGGASGDVRKSSTAAALAAGRGFEHRRVPPESREIMPLVKLADKRMYADKRGPAARLSLEERLDDNAERDRGGPRRG